VERIPTFFGLFPAGFLASLLLSTLSKGAPMRRLFQAGVTALVLGLMATPTASAQQSLNLSIGGFVPRAEDARGRDDVLVRDLAAGRDALLFNVKDFNGVTVNGEWLIGFGRNFEGSVGVGYYSKGVPSIYAIRQKSGGAEIEQELKLRIVPFTATVRFLPMGRHNGIEPYIGAGVAVLNWRYTESGEFVDSSDNTIFRKTYLGSGSNTGPVILGGVRVPVGSGGIGGEIRYQAGEGTLPSDQDFLGSKIDLGGISYLFTVNFRF